MAEGVIKNKGKGGFDIEHDYDIDVKELIETNKMPGVTVEHDSVTGEVKVRIDPQKAKTEPLPKI